MGVVIPQVVTEDRASGAQIVDGGLRFDSSKSHYLSRTPGSAGNRKTWTFSAWLKLSSLNPGWGVNQQGTIFSSSAAIAGGPTMTYNGGLRFAFGGDPSGTDYYRETVALFRDPSAWYHCVWVQDTTQSTGNRWKIYVNGVLQGLQNAGLGEIGLDALGGINSTSEHRIGTYVTTGVFYDGCLSNVHFIDGQALGPEYFGYTDPLTNVWRPKKLSSSIAFGTNGFYLPFDGSAPIGQDQSGNGNDWTPVNFGGSTSLEKATGALPILNTDGGGKTARVGVRTDENASDIVLALPLVGNKEDVSAIVKGSGSNKTVTNTAAVSFVSTTSNFYGGSAYFNGSHRLECDFSQSWTSDFTVEGWVYRSATGSNPTIYDFAATGGGYGMYAFIDTAASSVLRVQFYSSNSGGSVFGSLIGTAINVDSGWHHFAVVKSGTTYNLYQNGILTSSSTSSSNPITTTTLNIGNRSDESPTNPWYGYIQDFRVYVGTAKYTSNFIPASTDPDILPDTPSGVSYSSNLTQITDGAVHFDGSGDCLVLSDHADLRFGTNNYTVECFVYFNSFDDTYPSIISKYTGATVSWILRVKNDGKVIWYTPTGGGTNNESSTTPIGLKRWIHIAVVREGTGSNETKVYVNGQLELTITDANNYTDTQDLVIGAQNTSDANVLNGFMSNVHVVNGTALYTSNFTPPSAPLTSVANTKLLCCKSPTSATAADVTPGSITANGDAAATNFNPFTVDIDVVRGKQSGYCTWNPLDNAGTLSNGNLNFTYASAAFRNVRATFAMSSGKWYWEGTLNAIGGAAYIGAGTAAASLTVNIGASNTWGYVNSGNKQSGNTAEVSYGSSYTTGDVIGVAFDADNGTLTFYKNGVSQGQAYSGLTSGPYFFMVTGYNGTIWAANFGQKPFKFPPPAGFQPLTLANTPRPSIVRPDQYVGVTTYTGTGAARSIDVGFQPDFVWIKARTRTWYHNIFDTVRGATKALSTNVTDTEASRTLPNDLTSFTSNGFTLGASGLDTNENTSPYVAWCWKAGHPSTPTTGAVSFDGSGDYLTTADSADYPSGTDDFTYEAFVYLSANAGGNQYVLGKGGAGVAEQIGLLYNGTSWRVFMYNSSSSSMLDATWGSPTLNRWHHISVCRSGNNFYGSDNGVVTLLGTSSDSVLDNAALFAIGGYSSTTSPGGASITGFISNLRIIKGTALYTSNFTVPTAELTNVTNTTLLCCQSTTSATEAAVSPGAITANGNAAATTYNPLDAFSVDGTGYATASAAGLTAGTITPTGASVNTKSGFSIITYTGNSTSGATVSHGLENAPSLILVKCRSVAAGWLVYHSSIGATKYLALESSAAAGTYSGAWNDTEPTSSVISLGNDNSVNVSPRTYVAYCWAEIPGFSKFGSVTLAASADDAFINLGFRPRWFMIKGTGSTSNWIIFDSTRETFNFMDQELFANLANQENAPGSTYSFDFLSNGVKCRNQGLTGAFIYAAFAEAPSINLYGAQSNAR